MPRAAPSRPPALPPGLDARICYRALQTRDLRFDGRFFVGVRSTGVFCRPVCPARTPRRESCVFLSSAAAASEAGFRPCLRCRPEAAPGTPAWNGTSTTVTRALHLIDEGALDTGSVEELAARLGLGARHLRRLFLAQLGASPVAVAQSRRLLFAKKLLDETRLPISEVAFAAGFGSIRRFNDAVRRTWSRTPRELRAAGRRPAPGADLVLQLPYREPFDWTALADTLAARAVPGVECVSRERYARAIRLGEAVGTVAVGPVPGERALCARLRLSGPAPLVRAGDRLRRLFDLDADPERIAEHLAGDPLLAARVRARPGLRVPGCWDGFELAVRAILGQQVSVRGASTLAGRIADRYGEPLPPALAGDGPSDPMRLFPCPPALERLDAAAVGIPRARAGAISALARAVRRGEIALDAGGRPDEVRARLRALPGVGAWTAEIVALRVLREPDAFPDSDLGVRRALAAAAGGPGRPVTPRQAARRAEAWRPWRAYAALHLWTPPSEAEPAPLAREQPDMSTTSTTLELAIDRLESPLGPLTLATRAGALCALEAGPGGDPCERLARRFGAFRARSGRDPAGVAARLRAWLDGRLDALDGLALDPGGTHFERRVWRALGAVPRGETRSYGEIARAIGRPGAARAVGRAAGRNPVLIAIPCHRIVAADGSLGGYAGGPARKRWLLAHEGALPLRPARPVPQSASRTL